MTSRRRTTPVGMCPICGRECATTSDGWITGRGKHKDPATGQTCAGNGRKALGKEEQGE